MVGKTPRWKLFAALFAVLTVGSMALFFNLYEPWQPIGPDLIPDGGFSTPASTNGWSGWNKWAQLAPDGGLEKSPGVVLTTSSNHHGVLHFMVSDLRNVPALRVSTHIIARSIIQGKEYYYFPRAVLNFFDTKGKKLFCSKHIIAQIQKDTGWRNYKCFFPVPEHSATATLYIQNLGAAGLMQIDEVSMIPVKERLSAPWWMLFFGILWTTSFGFCIFALRPWIHRYGSLIIMLVLLIITGVALPGKLLKNTIEKATQTTKSLLAEPVKPAPLLRPSPAIEPVPSQSGEPKENKEESVSALSDPIIERIHQIGHFTLFSLLAFFSALAWLTPPSLRRAAVVYAGLAFFAAATEVLQFIPPDRSASLSDLGVDASGMAGAVVLVFGIRCIQRLINRD